LRFLVICVDTSNYTKVRLIARFLLHILANALAILTAEWLVPNVFYSYSFLSLMKLAALLGIINFVLKPILKTLAAPLILLSLGLFTIIINVFLVWLVTYLAPELNIEGLNAFFWTTIIIIAFNFIVSSAIREAKSAA